MSTRGVIFLFVIAIIFFNLMSSISASVDFFYSPSCPHCQKVFPLINDYQNYFKNWDWNFYDITKGSYDVSGVPLVILTTSDNRNIILQGSLEIPQKLGCELLEMSIPECVTYSADNCITES